MLKQIELWDLYDKNIYVKIEKQITKQFFENFIKNNPRIKIKIWAYKNQKYFTPLNTIIKILDLFPPEEKIKFKKLIESNIEELRFGRGQGKSIKNPKLPIKFSPELAKICGHLIGDGGIRLTKGDYAVHYTNKNPFLIEQFKQDILKIFGSIESYYYKYKIKDKNIDLKVIRFPSIIGVILMEFFGPMIKDTKKVLDIILDSNKKSKSLFLQALFDDEGCVSSNRIIIEISNKKIIEAIKNILESEFFIQPTNISEKTHEKGQNSYRLEIHGRKDICSFYNEINFSHPKKKEKLKGYVDNYKTTILKSRKGEIKKLIIDILKKENNKNVYEIAKHLKREPKRAFKKHLFDLEKEGTVKVKKGKNRIKIYSLQDETKENNP